VALRQAMSWPWGRSGCAADVTGADLAGFAVDRAGVDRPERGGGEGGEHGGVIADGFGDPLPPTMPALMSW